MLKKIVYAITASAVCLSVLADDILGKGDDGEVVSSDSEQNDNEFDWFLNLKGAHERSNKYAFGPKNGSGFAVNPVLKFGKFQLEGDMYYGRQFTFSGSCKGATSLSRITGNLPYFFENFNVMRSKFANALKNDLEKAHFYRNYTKLTYTDTDNNVKVVLGDTMVRNTIGFQQVLSGAGISIFRQSGDGSSINGGLPIVITRLSKVECKLNGEILVVKVLAPGLYTVNDLPEEAKIPGVTIKISDQLSRSETLNIDYFSGYGMPAEGKDDFDIGIICHHKWDIESPHRTRYYSKPYYHANYRYGYTDDITLAAGAQVSENAFSLDFVSIVNTEYGKIAPNVAFSHTSGNEGTNTFGAGLYYALPVNEYGIHFEAFAAAKGKGFGDLGKSENMMTVYNDFINKYFSDDADIRSRLLNTGVKSSSRQITARLYSDSICGIVPSFVFNGEWSKFSRLREYTVSLSTKLFDRLSVVIGAGLTYDDPSKGRNQRSPDRRLTVAFNWTFGKELSVGSTYSFYEAEKRRLYCSVTYTPEAIKGLELNLERFSRPGLSNPSFTLKYDNDSFNFKADENAVNTYEDKEAATTNSHSNRQRFYFGTSLSSKGFRAYRKSSFNVDRSL